jgi:hypothetical protein
MKVASSETGTAGEQDDCDEVGIVR